MRARLLVAFWVLAVTTLGVRGQAPTATPGQPTFRAGTTLVEVSAIVTVDGRPVTDLGAEDVTVLDNGKPQPIVAFERVDLGAVDGPAQRRDFVIVLDDLHVAPARTVPTIDVALRFVDMLGAHDRVAIVNTGPDELVLQLTSEREPARGMIRRFRGQASHVLPLEAEARAEAAMGVLKGIAAAMRTDAAERRTVLLISEGHATFRQESSPSLHPAAHAAFQNYLGVLREAALSNVAIYTVDPRGLVAPGGAYQPSREVVMTLAEPTLTVRDPEIVGSLAILARNTGGVQTLWTNDLTKVLPQLLRDSRQYYRIAYAQPDPPAGQKQPPSRSIKVEVSRRGVQVRARQRYAPIGES